MRYLPLALLLLASLASCSKAKNQEQIHAQSLVRKIPVTNLSHALSLADSASLHCSDPASCPANVGLVVAGTEDFLFTCTGFLISEDILATNSHCLPSAVRLLPDLCSERLRVKLPKTGGHQEEQVACKELLGYSERPNAISPDLALIRLQKKTGRNHFLVNHGGVKPGEKFSAYKINPGEGASGELIRQSCVSAANSFRFPFYRRTSDPVFLTGDCPSQEGNSGAPLINEFGQVVGIFQAELDLTERARSIWSPHLLPGEEFAPLAIGTSLRCLGSSSQWRWNKRCAPLDDENVKRPKIEDFASTLEPKSQELLAPHFQALPGEFRWVRSAVKNHSLVREETFSPSCFRTEAGWVQEIRNGLDPASLPSSTQIQVQLPILETKIRFNRYMQVSASAEIKELKQDTISFSPRSLYAEGKATASWNGAEQEMEFCPTE